jgi:hypothetical protein
MPRRTDLRGVAGFALGLAVALLPAFAVAAPTTATDLAAMRKLLGFDLAPGVIAERMLTDGPVPAPRDTPQFACLRNVLVTAYSAKIDASLKRTFASHEDVQAWQKFAATNGGRMLLAHLRDGVLAMARGTPPPSEDAFYGRLDANGQADIEAFVATPVGAKGPPHLDRMTAAESAGIDTQMQQRCGNATGK